ncbi:MAG: extracellular solute-binding protein [Longicatena sp.]
MKKLVMLGLSLAMTCSLAACSNSSKKSDSKEGDKTLVIYSPNSEGLIKSTIPLFEQKTGIKVQLQQAGTGELMKKLQSEKKDPIADILFGGAHSQYIQNKDLFMEYVSPNDKNVIETYQNKSKFTTSYALDGSLLIVNKKLKGNLKIESYDDLLNPELKGKIATADPASSSSAFAQLTNILKTKGGYEDDKAWAYVKDLFTNVNGKIEGSSSSVYKKVADGEMVVGLTYEDPTVTLKNDGADIEIVYPKEGSVFLPATAGIINNAKHSENAKKFIDFLISQEMQDIYGTETTNRPVLKKVKTGDNMKPMKDIKTAEEDQDYVNANKKKIVERYKEIFASIS